MTDKELISELRSIADKRRKGNRFDSLEYAAADRIEKLVKERDAMLRVVTDNHVALQRAETAEAKLTKAIAALDEAIYLLHPDEEDMAKEAGVYRIVTTHKELKEN
jgi:predicted nucleotide-binding protein